MNYIQSMPQDEVKALIEEGVPCFHKHGCWDTGWYGRSGQYNPMPAPGQITKEEALKLLPNYRCKEGAWWHILIPEDKSEIVFIEPSDSDLW